MGPKPSLLTLLLCIATVPALNTETVSAQRSLGLVEAFESEEAKSAPQRALAPQPFAELRPTERASAPARTPEPDQNQSATTATGAAAAAVPIATPATVQAATAGEVGAAPALPLAPSPVAAAGNEGNAQAQGEGAPPEATSSEDLSALEALHALAQYATRPPPQCNTQSLSIIYDQKKLTGSREAAAGRKLTLPLWAPEKERFMLLDCNYGRASNQKLCLRNQMVLASLANRTLLVDLATKQWHTVMDFDAMRQCFGPRTVITVQELLSNESPAANAVLQQSNNLKTPEQIQEQICRNVLQGSKLCHLAGSVNVFRTRPAWNLRWNGFYQNIVPFFQKLQEPIFATGDMTLTPFPPEVYEHGDIPIQRLPGCPTALGIIPNRKIALAAHQFVQQNFGSEPFLSVHWRLEDFLFHFCSGNPGGWTSTLICLREPTCDACIKAKAAKVGVTNVVVCTNGDVNTVDNLRKSLSQAGIKVIVNPQLQKSVANFGGAQAMAESEYHKLVLALGQAFIGTEASTFSADVMRMRIGIGLETCSDALICEGFPFKVQPWKFKQVFDSLV